MKPKNYLIVFIVVFTSFSFRLASGQGVLFGYDAAGNQISRERIIDMSENGVSINESSVRNPIYEEILKDMKITIYPNPTKGVLKIDITGVEIPKEGSIRIYNLRGGLVSQIQQIAESNLIDISAQPVGMYLMKIIIDSKHVSTWKIIKE